ncbi:hypothetical protein [Microcoleus sp. FACHB-672]|nr:hypothetical protein [Microcoleus sp. FACHB-672]
MGRRRSLNAQQPLDEPRQNAFKASPNRHPQQKKLSRCRHCLAA